MDSAPRVRPDPDELLHRLQERERLERRAQLKIFFGAVITLVLFVYLLYALMRPERF